MQYETVKIAIGIPTAGRITLPCVRGLLLLMDEFHTQTLYPETRKQSAFVTFQQSSVIAANRETMIEQALKADCTHVLFVDDDMEFTPDAVGILASRREPICGVNYRLRYPPAPFVARKQDPLGEEIVTSEVSTGIEAADYMGFGLCLIETRVFKAIQQPWFMPQWVDGKHTTEDIPFFHAAIRAGFTPYIDHDASKLVAHVGECHYRWDRVYQ